MSKAKKRITALLLLLSISFGSVSAMAIRDDFQVKIDEGNPVTDKNWVESYEMGKYSSKIIFKLNSCPRDD